MKTWRQAAEENGKIRLKKGQSLWLSDKAWSHGDNDYEVNPGTSIHEVESPIKIKLYWKVKSGLLITLVMRFHAKKG